MLQEGSLEEYLPRWSRADYGFEIFGFFQYDSIEKLCSGAIRAFLGVPKTAPIAGTRSEINCLEPRSKTKLKMIRMYHSLVSMPNHLLTKTVFFWDLNLIENSNFRTWTNKFSFFWEMDPTSNVQLTLRAEVRLNQEQAIVRNSESFYFLRLSETWQIL